MNGLQSRFPVRAALALGAAIVMAGVDVSVLRAQPMEIGTNFTVMRWLRQPGGCFRDVANVTGDNPWNPQFLKDIEIYRFFRFLSWDVGHAPTRKVWSERPQKSSPNQEHVAIEWCIDLCNRMNADMWVCTPHLTVDRHTGDQPGDYALRLCLLIKTGVDMKDVDLKPLLGRLSEMSAQDLIAAGGVRTCEPLKPELKMYLEYSNETWNGMFVQCKHARAEGVALRLAASGGEARTKPADTAEAGMDGEARGNGNAPAQPGGQDAVISGWRFHAWAAIRNIHAANLVWGKESKRVVRILAQQKGSLAQAQHHQAVIKDRQCNPWQVKADALAIAPYFGSKVNKTAISGNDPKAVEKMRQTIRDQATMAAEMRKFADGAGLMLIAYEGGQHVTEKADVINRDPVMYDLYMEYLKEMSRFFPRFCHFMHAGAPKPNGAFGAMEFTGQPLREAHKYRALADFVKTQAAGTPDPAGKPGRP